MVQQVNSRDLERLLQSESVVLADFYSDTCAPCRRMAPVFSELAQESGGRFRAVKVNVMSEGDSAARYNVPAVPTFILFRDGKESARIVGAVPKEELLAMVDGK